MINLLKRLNQHRITKIVVPVFLGFVVITVSSNLSAGSNQLFNIHDDSAVFIESSSPMFMNQPEENNSDQQASFSLDRSINWVSKSEVLP